MRCRFERLLLTSYLDKRLDLQRQRQIEAHLAGCEICRENFSLLKDTICRIKDSGTYINIAGLWGQIANIIERSIIPMEIFLKRFCYFWCGISTVLIAGLAVVYFSVGVPDQKMMLKKEDIEVSLWKEQILHLHLDPFNIEGLTIHILAHS